MAFPDLEAMRDDVVDKATNAALQLGLGDPGLAKTPDPSPTVVLEEIRAAQAVLTTLKLALEEHATFAADFAKTKKAYKA